MAVTSNIFTGDGSTTNYSFTFEYLEQDEVKVTLDGAATTAFTFANATTLSFTSAPANGVEIRIYRDTNIDTLKATFFPGSAIKAEDLNDNFTQNNFAVQEIKNNTWDVDTETIKSNETWVSSDSQIATTAAMDARFQDEATETIESTETWVSDDARVPTTAAVDGRIDTAITNDIGASDGITITDDGDGTITVGIGANSVDLDRIKDEDILTYAEEVAGSPTWDSDGRVPTTHAAIRRFDTIVQTTTPSGSAWPVGKTWLQNDADKTLSIWDGDSWEGISSGGTFVSQAKVVYVDATNGNDANDGHRISRPKATIKAAVNQINADATYGDGSVVVVAPGTYQEAAPIDIQKSNVSIIGQALRSCIVHPTVATEESVLFRLNSGSYIANLTLTGMKASGALGNTVDATLPVNQGWNFAFYPGATIIKSPYIQNCTNFSDSEIDNSNINVISPAGGSAGDTDSAPTGGGLLVDGSAVDSASPLRSMVCDSYTHVGLNGPGILVTNNGYAQCTSSYAFFNKYHIKALNGGQANLAASTTDFGDEALVADGKSTTNIFTSNVDGAANSGDITFNINAPTADASWHGSATRPQGNMLVTVNGVTYPVLSAVAHTDSEGGAGWTVTISRPNPSKRSENLGLNGAVSDDAAVSFYLRSMIASSGHTMEYVGSGTNYLALPENGGVPDNTKETIELNNGKIWAAITDHKGTCKVGKTFSVNQQTGFISLGAGSFEIPSLLANLNLNGFNIYDSTGSVSINDPLTVNSNRITDVADPTSAQDAATKNYVDTNYVATSDIGVTVQAYDADTAKYDDTTANFTGTLQNGGSNVVVDSDIGVNVQAYDATILKSADIGSTVQAYDADNAVTDVVQTFTAGQRGEVTTVTSSSGVLNIDFNASNNFYIELSENITSVTVSNATAGQSGSIFIAQPAAGGPYTVGGWAAAFLFSGGTAPTITATNSKTDRVDYVIRTASEIQVVWTGNY